MTEWNPTLYDQHHKFVSDFAENLVSSLNPQRDEHILDIGCGTGDLANAISKSGATVTGIDMSQSMIEVAKEKYPHIDFQLMDAEHLAFDKSFHAVFSNAAMHWMQNQAQVVQHCYNVLRPGGRFVAELGGAYNVQSIVDAIQEASNQLNIPYKAELFPWVFPTEETMKRYLADAGFDIVMMQHYERPTPLIGEDRLRQWLEMFGNNMFKHLTTKEKEAMYTKCEDILRPKLYKKGTWTLDYWRLRFIAKKVKHEGSLDY